MTLRTLFSPRQSSLWWCGLLHELAVSLIAVTGTLPLSQALSARTWSDRQYLLIRLIRDIHGEHSSFFRRLKNEEKFNFNSALLNRPQIHGEHDSRWKQRKETNSL